MPYVQRIEVRNHYKLPDFDIDLEAPPGDAAFRHLILTGPNGSGKTTILKQLVAGIAADLRGAYVLDQRRNRLKENVAAIEGKLAGGDGAKKQALESELQELQRRLSTFVVETQWIPRVPLPNEVVTAFLPATRQLRVDKPRSVDPVAVGPTQPDQPLASLLLRFLVNQQVQARLAKDEDPSAAEAIARWLAVLEQSLGDLFEIPGLRMQFIRKDYDIHFVEPSGTAYDFNQLAAGHASILNILAEILLRIPEGGLMGEGQSLANSPGVVIIDELETHLHPALQERILPFLVRTFPQIQFIVATHSPAVICSIDNALVWDLRSGQGILSSELRGTPYGDLMKTHFGIETDIDLESTEQLKRLRVLRDTPKKTPNEQAEFRELAQRLRKTSQTLALEVWLQLEQSELAAAGE